MSTHSHVRRDRHRCAIWPHGGSPYPLRLPIRSGSSQHVRHRRIRGREALSRSADRRPREARVPRLRLRGSLPARQRAHRLGASGRQPRQPARRGRRRGGARRRGRGRRGGGDDRPRPHPLGDPRPRHRGERPPAQRRGGGVHIVLNGIVENHSELRRELAPRARVQLRDRRRDRRPPDREALRRRSHRRRPRRLRRAPRPLRVRRDARSSTPTRWSAPATSARSSSASARARPSSPRRSPPSCARPAP